MRPSIQRIHDARLTPQISQSLKTSLQTTRRNYDISERLKMANQEIDMVSEVLKKLSKKDNVKPEDAKKAIAKYNDMVRELSDYKTESEKRPPSSERTEGRLKVQIDNLQQKLESKKKDIEELKRRLSAVMGQKIKEGNADIADLSDQHRPTKLAEHFKSLYDDEWTSAFEEIDKTGKIKGEDAIIDILNDIVKAAGKFCASASSEYLDKMLAFLKDDITNPKVSHNEQVRTGDNSVLNEQQEKKLEKIAIDIRKEFAELSVRPLGKIFYESQLKPLLKNKKLPESMTKTNEFVARLLHITWMMKVQDPVICLVWQDKGEAINKDKFTFYTKRGDTVAYCVWPAVLLHEDGPLMSKGVLQAK